MRESEAKRSGGTDRPGQPRRRANGVGLGARAGEPAGEPADEAVGSQVGQAEAGSQKSARIETSPTPSPTPYPDGDAPVLLVCRSPVDAERIRDTLARQHVEISPVSDLPGEEFRSVLKRREFSVLLTEHHPPELDALGMLRDARELLPGVPCVVLMDPVDAAQGAVFLEAGATEVIPKSDLWRLAPSIARALEEKRLQRALDQTQQDLAHCNLELESGIRNRSLAMVLQDEMLREDLRLSEKIHQLLLPREIPPVRFPPRPPYYRTMRFASLYRPARVMAGDFFHVNRISDSMVHVFLGDVMGHGTRATLVSTMLRLINQSFLEDASPPNRLLHRMNQALCRVSRESDLLVFATACALTLDLKNGTLRFASAGHPPPVVLPADGSPPLPLGTERQRRPALGIFPDAVYSVHEEKLRGNDKVLLFTDGIFDVENAAGQFLTPESLWREASRQAHLPLQGILDALLAYLEKFSGLQAFPDDVCMLGIQIEPFPRRAA